MIHKSELDLVFDDIFLENHSILDNSKLFLTRTPPLQSIWPR